MSELVISPFEIQPLIDQRDGAAILRWAYSRSFLDSNGVQVSGKIEAPTTALTVSVLGQFTQRLRRSEPTWQSLTEKVYTLNEKLRAYVFDAGRRLRRWVESIVPHAERKQLRLLVNRPIKCGQQVNVRDAEKQIVTIELFVNLVKIETTQSSASNVKSGKTKSYVGLAGRSRKTSTVRFAQVNMTQAVAGEGLSVLLMVFA